MSSGPEIGQADRFFSQDIVLTELADDRVRALSKGIGINADGTSGSVTYEDTISRGDQGWRISHRKVLARRAPWGGN
jgi:hypothetical protein